MTRQEKIALGIGGVIAAAALWWFLRGGGTSADATVSSPDSYLTYNQPRGNPWGQTIVGLPGVGSLGGGSNSCGCSGNSGLNNTLFADTSQLVDYYNSTIQGFAGSALSRLSATFSDLFASPAAVTQSHNAASIL